MIPYITDRQKPRAGKPNKAILALPKRVKVNTTRQADAKMRKTILLSIIFNNTSPRTQPTVIMPQNNPTVAAPSVSGLKP